MEAVKSRNTYTTKNLLSFKNLQKRNTVETIFNLKGYMVQILENKIC